MTDVLFGRKSELDRLRQLLEAARRGQAQLLCLRGEPGVGKTALLLHMAGTATGFTVLSCSGMEAESDIAFSGLSELLGPLTGRLDQLPPRQAEALATALALGSGEVRDPLAVGVATLTLLSRAAVEGPVLCVVDDANWLDSASAGAILFAARRLADDAVAVVAAVRQGCWSAFDAHWFPSLVVSEVSRQAADQLLREAATDPLADDVAERLLAVAGGNPLSLIELLTMLSREERMGSVPLPHPLRVPGPVEHRFVSQLAGLPDRTRLALLVAAASETNRSAVILPAIRAVAGDASALDPAAQRHLVQLDADRVVFRHPLVRSAVYQFAAPAERRLAHQAIADALPAAAEEQRAWHRALAAEGPDEAIAAALEQAASVARRRGGLVAEARALDRSAHLSSDSGRRAQRLYRAGAAAFFGGRTEYADRLLNMARAEQADRPLAADIEHELARLRLWTGRPEQAWRIEQAADQVRSRDPERAARLLSWLTVPSMGRLEAKRAAKHAHQAWSLLGHRPEPVLITFKIAFALAAAGETAVATQLARDCAWIAQGEEDSMALTQLGGLFTWLGDHPRAERLLDQAEQICRDEAGIWMLTNLLVYRSELERRRGRLQAALVAASEAVRLSDHIGQALQVAAGLVQLAVVEAALGRTLESQAHVREARRLTADDDWESRAGIAVALCWSALAAGRPEAVPPSAEPVVAKLRDGGFIEPGAYPLESELAEAYARTGATDSAITVLDDLERRVQATGRKWLSVTCVRARALVAIDDPAPLYEQALQLGHDIDMPLEQARTHLYYGEWLRRHQRVRQSRDHLVAAERALTLAGAQRFAERARRELRAAGGRVTDPEPLGVATVLTPQELQIAIKASQGARNREIACELFLSEKTVEAHLGRAYRKLGVRSRTELSAALKI